MDCGNIGLSWDWIIIGAGAAGLMAAARAAEYGKKTLLLEKNSKVGVKILMSGGTRCNITQATDEKGIANAFGKQGRFLRSALAALSPRQVVELIEDAGVPTKTEETGKIFPVSDRAIDVRDALLNRAIERGVYLLNNSPVSNIRKSGEAFYVSVGDTEHVAANLLITSGGQSYPGCGTTGDGYAWARQFGHRVVQPVPALTPITTNADWIRDLKGITISDARVSIVENNPQKATQGFTSKDFLDSRRSSLLLTHFGFSGPAALDVSRTITRYERPRDLSLICDFFPEPNFEQFYLELGDKIKQLGKKQIASIVTEFVPRRLAEAVVQFAELSGEAKAAELSKKQIRKLALAIKSPIVPVSGTLGFKKAEVTAGGVCLDEIDSSTMQSKIVPGLYFAGEVLDVDGPIGGYNFQAAFSTGWLAGSQ